MSNVTKYGQIAISAAKLSKNGQSPMDAWKTAALNIFPEQESSREKGCPQNTFLGLCVRHQKT
jgi:uncharacterized protein DUF6979